jgi:DNA polymerase
VDVLLDHLRAELARGVEHVFLDEEAREVLRELHRRTAAARKEGKPAPAAAPAAARTLELRPEGATAAEKIASLRAQAEDWAPAKALGSLRETMVFSTGNPEADLMLVGEAPGHHEERQREPFVGPAGQKLDDILKAMGIERASVYISNIVKFRPAMPSQTTNNRKPTLDEMAACLPFVREEVKVVRPKCIVALGGTAAEGLLGLSGAVGAMRGKWHDFDGIPVRVTYHPAYLLHGQAALGDKRKIWEDMLEVMEKLGLPISDRQRGFFLPKG